MSPVQNHKIIPLVTSIDGDLATNEAIQYDPANGISVTINGIQIMIGDGNKNEASYFSSDGGNTAKRFKQIKSGDKYYWNGSIAGYQLDGSDDLRFNYERKKNRFNKVWFIATSLLFAVAAIIGILADGSQFWDRVTTPNTESTFEDGELVLTQSKIELDIEDLGLHIYKTDTILIECTKGTYVLQDSSKISSVKYTDEEFLHRDESLNFFPSINLLSCSIENKILNENNIRSTICFELDMNLVGDGYQVAWFEDNEKLNLAEITYCIWYKHNNNIDSTIVKNIVQLTKETVLDKKN